MAELGTITGQIIPTQIIEPKIVGYGHSCSENKNYIVWIFDKSNTGYIIYRDDIEIFNGTISEFRNAGNMFNPADHDTNLFHRTRNKLLYEDLDIKKFKEHTYTYQIQAYQIQEDDSILLSNKSNPCSL